MAMCCFLFLVAFLAFFANAFSAGVPPVATPSVNAHFPAKVEVQNVVVKDLRTKILNGPKNGAAYVSIYNGNSYAITLQKVEVTPGVFDRVELHDHIVRIDANGNKYMQMIEISAMEIAAGETLSLVPGSRHLMLMDIKPTYCNEKTLTFKFLFRKNSGETFDINVEVPVEKDSQRCGG